MTSQVNLIIPLDSCRSHAYLYDEEKARRALTADDLIKGVRCAFNVDTEFYDPPTELTVLDSIVKPRQGVTCQISPILHDPPKVWQGPPMIFDHPDHEQYALSLPRQRRYRLRHPVMRSGCLAIDYFQHQGEDIEIFPCEDKPIPRGLPIFLIDFYAFFALAENTMIFTGPLKAEQRQLAIEGNITQHRRLTSRDITGPSNWQLDYVRLNAVLVWNGKPYAPRIRWIDAGAIHGVASYRDFLINVGLPVEDKDLMKELDMIERMHIAYFRYPKKFDRYALGDLHVYKALKRNSELSRQIYKALGTTTYFIPPFLTIGRTQATLDESTVFKLFDVPHDDKEQQALILKQACEPGTAQHFREETTSTVAIQAKVVGGRVGADRMLLTSQEAVWFDSDLANCYATTLKNMQRPFGRPMSIKYPTGTPLEDMRTLRQELDHHHYWNRERNELVPYLWLAYVSMKSDVELKHPQTFFPSYYGFNPKREVTSKLYDDMIVNLQEDRYEFAVDSGNVKIFSHHIQNAPLGQHGLEWVLYACGPKQRDELLDNLYVQSMAYYKRSDRVSTIAELRERWGEARGQNKCEDRMLPDKDGKLVTTQYIENQPSYAWISKNMGEMSINAFLTNRNKYAKGTPLNNRFKLSSNTAYGVIVSPHFPIGNVVFGGNVTEAARAGCWYMVNTCNGVQSITDGTQGDLNHMVHLEKNTNQQYLTQGAVYNLRLEKRSRHSHITLKPLPPYDSYTLESEPEKLTLRRWKNGVDEPLSNILLDPTPTPPLWSKDIQEWLNPALVDFVRHSWDPRITVLNFIVPTFDAPETTHPPIPEGLYKYEVKDLYTRASFHGAANYLLENAHDPVAKHRSYSKRVRYDAYRLERGLIVRDPYYDKHNPLKLFMFHLRDNPCAVPRGLLYVYKKMLRPNELSIKRKSLGEHTDLSQGDSYCMPGLFREYSHSQYRFKNADQRGDIEKEYMQSRKRHGQYVECFFVNPDGTLNVQRMLIEVQAAIDTGTHELISYFNSQRHFARQGGTREHPAFPALQIVKARLNNLYHGIIEEHDMEMEEIDGELRTQSHSIPGISD